ncbi:hypothetical protein Pla52o_15010 [Novipirellula galeiformis]|uniref:DUF2071 domain-containing protein n=1 Tax=Novipirellula galeiformis TaxID=2528004 RepID=A0A5C6CK11_9BACT|nr:DUF2071 domain-containing protein [Novipirellula galeiformis]TWU25203.1 hypothetical protein Pla52o_15010 [Novipirellula galeiformis]
MNAKTDRTWSLPSFPWAMRMTWSELLFAHWPVDPERVARLLPAGMTLDTHQGQAWVGVVPFLMSNVSPRCCQPLPRLSRFLELNVRTYVIVDGKPGVWFFSLDAESRVAVRVARATFNLPYMDAKMSLVQDESGAIEYRSERTHRGEPSAAFAASYQATGEPFYAAPGTLEYWLTARYCLYSADRKGRLCRGEIDHPPWRLSPATWTQRHNTMTEPCGFPLTDEPHLLFAQPVTVRAWMVTRCDR